MAVDGVSFVARNHPQQVATRGAQDSVDDRETDPELFGPLHARFGFTIDVAASTANAKLERFLTIEANGLHHSWRGERVWCNPPFSGIRPWIEKAWQEHRNGCDLVVMLLPANRTEQGWWQDLIEPFRDRSSDRRGLSVEFLRGRRRFIYPGRGAIGPNERPPFGVCLAVWRR